MLHKVVNYFKGIPSMYIDGTLHVLKALFAAMLISFTADTANKYIAEFPLWLIVQLICWLNASVVAISMFRSDAFAKHNETKKKEKNYETQMFDNTNPSNTKV